MTAPNRNGGREAFELPRADQYGAYRKPAVIYTEEMARRRLQVQREQKERRNALMLRRAVCAVAAMAVCAMLYFCVAQRMTIWKNAQAIANINDEIHELSIDAEVALGRITDAENRSNIESRAKTLGMIWTVDDSN